MQESLSHVKTEKFRIIIIKAAEILAYMSLNSSWKVNTLYVDLYEVHSKLAQNPKLKKPITWSKQALDPSSKQSFN